MLRCQPGWRAEVIAQAPAISAPSVVCCAPDGRIFLGQDLMDMGSPTDKPGDKILCIYPDGKIKVFATNLYAVFGLQYIDGKVYVHHSPKFSVFDDHDGVGVNRRDLIASDNPHPWLPSFNDHIPSGFHLAMDGYFYISTGDKGILGAVGTDGRKIEMRGGIYRMRPDGTELEVYCTGTRNHLDIAMNPEDEMFTYDNTDDGGGWWSRVTHMVDGGYYGYPYDFKPQHPYTLWDMVDYGGGAATGTLSYNEDALPEEYRGNLFLDEWAGAQVYRLKIKRVGSTYEVVSRVQYDGTNLLKSVHIGAIDQDFVTRGGYDIGFRPVGICVTPDGMGFYVTDWGLSGWKNSQVVGRLFKVTYTGKSLAAPKPKWYIPAATGKPFKASTSALVKALSHPSQSVRMVAQRRLAERHSAAEKKLAALLKNTKAPPYARWSAIWTLDAIDGGTNEHQAILAALQDKDPTVQSQAARELGTRQARDAVAPLSEMLDSTNAMLRFRAATALGRIDDPAAVMPLRLALAQKDLFARYAAFKALNRIGLADPTAWPEIVKGLDSVNPRIREGAYFATRETYDLGLVKALAAYLGDDTLPTEPRTNILNLLSSLYLKPPAWNGDWWNTMPVNGSPPAKSERWEGSGTVAVAMHHALEDPAPAMRQIAFEWVRTSHDTNAASFLRVMFEHETELTMQTSIVRALGGLNNTNSRAVIGPILKNPQTPVSLLDAALEAAETLGGNEWNSDLIRLADHPANDAILLKLFEIFGKNKIGQVAPLLGKNLTNSNVSFRQGAVAALTQIGGETAIAQFLPGLDNHALDIRRQSIQALGDLKAKTALPQLISLSTNAQLSQACVQALTEMPDMAALNVYLDGLGSKNATLRALCRKATSSIRDPALPKIEAKLSSTNGLPDDTVAILREIYQTSPTAKKGPIFKIKVKLLPLADYQSFALARPGNAYHGKTIFLDVNGVNCIRCHRMSGQGALIGPELTDVGSKQSREQLIESVLYPSKVILDGYQQVFFKMKDDDDYSGIIRSETPEAITIIDSLGKTNVLRKSDIKSRKTSQISLMPEGLQTGLTLQDFSDLITFLQNPNGPPMRMASLKTDHSQTDPPPADPMDFLNLPPLPMATEEPAPAAIPAPTAIPIPAPLAPMRHPRHRPIDAPPILMPPMPPGPQSQGAAH